MSRKFTVWLNSGANIHSTRRVDTTLEELGYSSDEWDLLSEEGKDDVMREVAFEQSDWGYREIDSQPA